MIGTGVMWNFQAERNAPPVISSTRKPRYGLTRIQTLAHIMPDTAATVPAIAAIAKGCAGHVSKPRVSITTRIADGKVTASTAARAPRNPKARAAVAAQNASTLVPGVTRASE